MPMVRPIPGPRPLLSKLGHLAIQLGFANSIRPFDGTPGRALQRSPKPCVFRANSPSQDL